MNIFNPINQLKNLNRLGKSIAGLVALVVAIVIFGHISPDFFYTLGAPSSENVTTSTGFGFATDLSGMSTSDLNQRMSDMKATGVTWVRYDLDWRVVQPNSPSSYNWSSYDSIAKAAQAHGLKVLLIIDFAPSWATSKNCPSSEICAPTNPIAYANFAGQAAAHFKPFGITDFEIWNEPNTTFRFEPAVNPALYTRMLKDSYASIKRANSKAVVITGGTSPAATDGSNYTPADFMAQLYKDGAAGYFNAVAVHPYTYPIDPTQSQSTDAWGQMTTIHNMMVAHGDGNKQIWLTEFGAPTNGPDQSNFVSEAMQAQIATDSIQLYRRFSWAGPMFWYNYTDTGTSTSTNENFFGLVRGDGSQKPAYNAFVQAIQPLQ
jgi:hypothetical protein